MRVGVFAAVLAIGFGVTDAASAAKLPVYKSPKFKGSTKAPPVTPAPPPTPVTLSPSGLGPDAVIDDAGTAHVVWSEGRGDAADAVVYCRIKRSASSCDTTASLTPVKDYGVGDGPQYDIDNSGPHIVRIGDQLVILSYRYPTGFERPDGAGSGGVVAWVSDDGGTSWSGGKLVAKGDINGTEAVPFGAEDSPRIATISQEGACATCVQQIRPGAYDGGQGYLGDTGPDQNYDGSLAVDNGQVVATYSDLSNKTYVRRWGGTDPITSVGTWAPPTVMDGTEPTIASGPSGLYVMNRPALFKPFQVRKVTGGAVGPPTVLTQGDSVLGRLTEDASGRLMAVWTQRDGKTPGVRLRSATGGAGFTSEKLLLAGASAGQLRARATSDGGGFLVANATGGIVDPGQIVAVGFGTKKPTGLPGLAGVRGGGDPNVSTACEKITFGAVDVRNAEGCFLHGTGQYAKVNVSEGELDLNGLRIVPDQGSKIVIDPKAKKLYSTGGVRVILSGGGAEITLFHGQLKLQLDASGAGALLASFDTSAFGVDALGFPVKGRVDVFLTQGGVRIPVSLQLPKYMGDVRGNAELIGRSGSGLQLTSLNVHVGTVPLGPIIIKSFDLKWAQGGTWSGAGSFAFGSAQTGPALDAKVVFENGSFKEGSADYFPPPPGITLAPFVYLTQIGGTIGLDPTHIQARAKIGAGAAVKGVSPVSVLGSLDLTAPASGPFTVEAKGTLSLLAFQVADATFRFVSDGYADFSGHVGLNLAVLSLDGTANGFVDTANGSWGTSAKVDVCIDLSIGPVAFPCIGGDFAMNPKGGAVCISASLPGLGTKTGGLELPWDDVSPAVLANPALLAATIATHLRTPCHTDAFASAPRARSIRQAAPGSVSVTIPAGLPTATLAVLGTGGAPDVSVSGPGGAGVGTDGYVARSGSAGAAYVVISKPAAGTWTVTPNSGSPAIRDVLLSHGYTAATVSGHLGGHARARTLSYRLSSTAHGQSARFVEQGAFGQHVLGTSKGTRGTLRFAPADAKGGRRTVVAQLLHDGMVTSTKVIGSYLAPSPRVPGRPGRVRVRRGKTTATVTWGAARNADRYLVAVRGSHGRRQQFIVKARRVVVYRVVKGDRISASVRGLTNRGRRGPVRRG